MLKDTNKLRHYVRWVKAASVSALLFLSAAPAGYASVRVMQPPQARSEKKLVLNKQNNVENRRRISLKLDNVTLSSALELLTKKARIGLSIQTQAIPDKKVTLNLTDVSIYRAVDILLEGTGLEAVLPADRDVLVIRQKLGKNLKGQIQTVQGIVTDSQSGESLPGVNIVIKGTTTGTSTDPDGHYKIQVPSLSDTLMFTFIGYKSREIPVNGQSEINVDLETKTIVGEEAVVTAFGEELNKEDVVGSVTSFSPAELSELKTAPTSNLTTSLAGQVAGIIAFQRSGEPGQDNADFFIRGVTTFGYKKNPLILIDNIESTTRDLARLQPDDIANFSILKDATATSLYGSRAANGVILIKTKEGFKGKARVSLRMENSISMPTQEVNLANPIQYMELNNEAVLTRDPLAVLPYSDRKIDNTKAGVNPYVYPATNWRDKLFKDYATNQRLHLNVRGGGNVARYYVAGAVNQDNGILKVDPRNNFNNNINLKSYSLRSNVDVNLTNTTKIAVKLNGSFDDYNGPVDDGDEVYKQVMRTNPVRFPPVYPKTDKYQYVQHPLFGNYEDKNGNYLLNPYAQMVRGYRQYSQSIMSAQFEAEQDLSFITEGLEFSGLLNTRRDSYFTLSREYTPFWYQANSYNPEENSYNLSLLNEEQGTEYLNYVPGAKTVSSSFFMQSKLNYRHDFLDKHTVSGMLIFTARNEVTGNAPDLQSSLPRRNINLAGRATYTYDDRYYGQFNFAYNGSERFYKSHRFGFFPSFGVAWRISNEDFWKSLENTVDNLRLRATYGFSGNDAIGTLEDRFLYLSEVNLNDPDRGATFGTDNNYHRNGMSLSRYSNPKITWERSQKTNIALDLGLFNKVDFQAEFFKEHRSNILMGRAAIPASMGLSTQPQANIGEAVNRGIDLSLTYSQGFNKGWLQIRGNFTYAHNEFLVYEEYQYNEEPWKSHVGYPINQQYGYIAERLFVDDKEAANSPKQNFGEYGGGDIKYRDVNGDGQITQLDQVPIGYPTTPEIVYGFGFSAGYKNFDVSAFFQGLGRESFWINANSTAPFIGDKQLLKAYADSHWSEQNQDLYALWPRLSASSAGTDNNSRLSTWFMRDGSFLRLKRIEIGYTLPDTFLQRFSMREFRIYINGTNLLTWSKFNLWDVEMGGSGLGYPIQRVFNVGIDVSF